MLYFWLSIIYYQLWVVSYIGHLTSNIRHPTSNILPPTSYLPSRPILPCQEGIGFFVIGNFKSRFIEIDFRFSP